MVTETITSLANSFKPLLLVLTQVLGQAYLSLDQIYYNNLSHTCKFGFVILLSVLKDVGGLNR